MKRFAMIFAAAAVLLSSCEEWDPVVNVKYDDVYVDEGVTMTPNTTIAELKALYTTAGQPVKLEDDDMVIGGQVISEDRAGNIYRSLYIQDESGAIELKLGKTSLYNDYKPGQWVYVRCMGLELGNYNGMLQLGLEDASGSYETAYMLADYLISSHVFRGEKADPLAPEELTEDQVAQCISDGFQSPFLGRYVTLRGLKYGCKTDKYSTATTRIFALIYIDPSKDTKLLSNRIFLSDETYGVTTWAMSKLGFLGYLNAGNFDSAKSADDARRVSDPDLKAELNKKLTTAKMTQSNLAKKLESAKTVKVSLQKQITAEQNAQKKTSHYTKGNAWLSKGTTVSNGVASLNTQKAALQKKLTAAQADYKTKYNKYVAAYDAYSKKTAPIGEKLFATQIQFENIVNQYEKDAASIVSTKKEIMKLNPHAIIKNKNWTKGYLPDGNTIWLWGVKDQGVQDGGGFSSGTGVWK